jgi:hypothetical protein
MQALLPVFTAVLGLALAFTAHAEVKNVVVVHSAFADGSGWEAIADIQNSALRTSRIIESFTNCAGTRS